MKTISTLVLINRGAHFQRNAFDPNIDGSNKFPKYQIFLKYRFFPWMDGTHIINHKRKMIYLLENANTWNKVMTVSKQHMEVCYIHDLYVVASKIGSILQVLSNVRIGWKRNACEFIIRWKSNGDIRNLSRLRFNSNVSRVHLFQMKALDFFC